jgi:ABC-type sugar transport system permease subunit
MIARWIGSASGRKKANSEGKLLTRSASRKSRLIGLAMILPCLFVVFIRTIVPSFDAFRISLSNVAFRPGLPTEFVGFQNWIRLIHDSVFWQSLWNTLLFSAANISIGFTVALCISVVLNRDFRGCKIVRVLLIVPWAVPYVSNGLIWQWIYTPSYGVLNGLLRNLRILSRAVDWLGNVHTAMPALIVAQTWKDVPFMAIMLIAALKTFPDELREAAVIDGASRPYVFFRVTIPYLRVPFLFILILQTINAVKVMETVYVLTRGGPGNATRVIFLYSYEKAFQLFDLGYGCALSFVIFLIILFLMLTYLRLFSPSIDAD